MTVHHPDLSTSWLGYATTRIETPDGFVAYLDPGRYGVLTGEWTPWSDDAHTRPRPTTTPGTPTWSASPTTTTTTATASAGSPPDATVVVFDAVDSAGIDRDVTPVRDLPYETVRVGYGDEVTVPASTAGDATVEAVPAYNRPDGPRAGPDGRVSHPRGLGCGYRLVLPGAAGSVSVFYPGDSDRVPEHEGLDATAFCPPISGELTMGPVEAADLAASLAPDLAVPVHYDTFPVLAGDSRRFAVEVASRGIPVALDER